MQIQSIWLFLIICFFLGEELVEFCFEGVEAFMELFVVVGHHGVDEYGVDERHAYDATDDEQHAEVEAHEYGDGGAVFRWAD